MRVSLLLALLTCGLGCMADGDRYALIAKSIDDPNFFDTWLGCQEEARKFNDECVLLGGSGPVNPHTQYAAIEEALASNRYVAMAVSVTKSEFIAEALTKINIPLVTYDSPFNLESSALSLGYIGPDNQAFGYDLGKAAMAVRPNGGVVCIFTASHDPNLLQRVFGIRQALSKLNNRPNNEKLTGENGWIESERCPLNTSGSALQAMDLLEAALTLLDVDILISVGHWPIENPNQYRKTTYPYRNKLKNKNIAMIVAVGKIQPSYQELLNDGLLHGLVGINFKEIGRLTYQRMREAHQGLEIPTMTKTENTTLMGSLTQMTDK